MNLQDWGALGDMIGGIAVVASLIYLAIQIRQNTRQISHSVEATRLAAFERNIESANRMREMLILNPQIATLYQRGIRDYASMEASEKFRFGLLMRNILAGFQGGYLRHKMVSADAHEFDGTVKFITSVIDNPGARSWLSENDVDWRPEFQEFMDELLAKLDRQNAER